MIVNNANLVLKQVNLLFAKQMQKTEEEEQNNVKRYAEYIKSQFLSEDYLFFENMPVVEEWLDRINYDKFSAFAYTIRNKGWQFGIPIKREIVENAQTNGVLPQIEKFVNEASRNWADFPSQLISELIELNGTAFDGANFFANSRPDIEGGNAINNIVAGTGITVDKVFVDLNTAIDRLYGFKARNNRAYNRGCKVLVLIPPQLRSVFQTLKVGDRIDIGGIGTNTLKDGFDFIISYEQKLTDNDYYVINENAVIKPFIFQTRQEPLFDMIDEKDAPYIKYFSTAYCNAGYGNPMSIVKVNN